MNQIPIYVIGLESNFRGTDLLLRYQDFKLKAFPIFGPDYRNLQKFPAESKVNQELAIQFIYRNFLMGEIGCYMGHISAIKSFLGTESEWALILEDDAKPLEEISSISIDQYLSSQPTIIQVHDHTPNIKEIKSIKYKKTNMYIDNRNIGLKKLVRPLFGTSAYLINRKAANVALSDFENFGVYSTVDWPPGWVANIEFWRSETLLFFHDTSGSNTQIDVTFSRLKDLERLTTMKKFIELLQYLLGLKSFRSSRLGNSFKNTYMYGLVLTRYRILYLVSATKEKFRI